MRRDSLDWWGRIWENYFLLRRDLFTLRVGIICGGQIFLHCRGQWLFLVEGGIFTLGGNYFARGFFSLRVEFSFLGWIFTVRVKKVMTKGIQNYHAFVFFSVLSKRSVKQRVVGSFLYHIGNGCYIIKSSYHFSTIIPQRVDAWSSPLRSLMSMSNFPSKRRYIQQRFVSWMRLISPVMFVGTQGIGNASRGAFPKDLLDTCTNDAMNRTA